MALCITGDADADRILTEHPFALVAGMMLAVSFMELLPAARRYETHYSQSLVGFFLGAVVMALSLQLLAPPVG